MERFLGSMTSDLMKDFELGIGRLVWRDSLSTWYLPITFILDKDWCNTSSLFLMSPREAASNLQIQESILTDWMTMMLHGFGPGYPVPWLVNTD